MTEKSDSLLQPSPVKRKAFFLLSDFFIITLSLYAAFLIRFEFDVTSIYKEIFFKALPLFITVKLALFSLFGLYRITWRYVDIYELGNIYISTVMSECILMVLILIPFEPQLTFLNFTYIAGFPRSIFLIDMMVSSLFLSGLRISKRLYLEKIANKGSRRKGIKTVILGSGRTGEMIIRDIEQRGYSDFYPIGLLDDDKRKVGGYIHGIKVLGSTEILKEVITRYHAEAVIIAIPSLNHKALKNIYQSSKECGIKNIKIVPRIYDFQRPDINLKNLEDISIEDLIGRQTVAVDHAGINAFIKGKSVLITGAGGSIGSEIVLQVCSFDPERVILFDIDETELHSMSCKIKRAFPEVEDRCNFIAGDIRDANRLDEIFKTLRPNIVFHAAAYKHVPMMESNPKEAIKVNVFGTYSLAETSARFGVSKFILISTDKAIRPTSIMGASKRIAEYICQAFNKSSEKTEYVSVRFGNVLGSRGSVLPLFLDQLKHGGPLTVTDPEMKRYFMTIPEAVSLVLQASAIGNGGEVLVLDMGESVKIVTLAEELIKLHGLKPYIDIDITFTGLRPGEKLFEEILTAEEGTMTTKHNKIFIAKNSEMLTLDEIKAILKELERINIEASMSDSVMVRETLKKYVKHYSSDGQ
ncbi:MAG: polysaccharide biosynthesis protein [Nitrospiraceae bacterium]|nr:polysaccharide biosynthesis protein [Nitrospiraceae bacterium]